MVIGVLALQGDFQEHGHVLDGLGATWLEVRTSQDLERCGALIIPGGESTTMWKLMQNDGLDSLIKKCAQYGMPILGTCAGAILLSDSHLNLIDISVDRNAYGSQAQSFSTEIEIQGTHVPVEFIRAPKITRVGSNVRVLASESDDPVFVEQGNILAVTFHTETVDVDVLHQHFLGKYLSTISVQ